MVFKNLIFAVLLGLVAFLVFSTSLGFHFVYDDHVEMDNFDELLRSKPWYYFFSFSQYRLYRPVKYVTLKLNYQWGNFTPFAFHLTNLILHALVTVLVFLWVGKLFGNRLGALLGALWFAVHPIHTEAVVWISARGAMLSALGILASVMSYLEWRRHRRTLALVSCLFCAAFAFFSKEDALMLLPLIIVVDHFFISESSFSERIKKSAPAIIGIIACALIYLLLRQSLIQGVSQGRRPFGIAEWLIMLPYLLFRYLVALIFPSHLCADYGLEFFRPAPLIFIASIVCTVAVIVLLLSRSRSLMPVRFSLLWMLIFLFPVSGVVPLNQIFADRFLYLPSVAGSLLIGAYVPCLTRLSKPLQTILMVLFVGSIAWFGYQSFTYARVWHDDETLWTHIVEKNPQSYRGWANLAAIENNQGRYAKALELVHKALQVHPDYLEGHLARAYALDRLGRYEEAEQAYQFYLARAPHNPQMLYVYADFLERTNRFQQAEQLYEQIFSLRPGYVDARNAAAILAMRMGKPQQAIEHWTIALQYDSNNPIVLRNLEVARRAQE